MGALSPSVYPFGSEAAAVAPPTPNMMPIPHPLTRREFLAATWGLAGLFSAPRVKGHPTKENQMEYYVSPEGKDTWSGTRAAPDAAGQDGPFATLEAARDAIRGLKGRAGLPAGGVRVLVRGGTYSRATTFSLTADDSGTAAAPITYAAYEDEEPRLSGGQEVTGFAPVHDPAILARIPATGREHVLQCDLAAAGITDFGSLRTRGFNRLTQPTHLELFYDDLPMTLARWPNDGWAKVIQGPADEGAREFTFTALKPAWATADDPWLYAYWKYDWADTWDRVRKFDFAAKTISLASGGDWGIATGARFRVVNLLEELDTAGEWYLDRASGILYFWPPVSAGPGRATVSLLEDPLVTLAGVEHVTLQGLTFECTRGHGIVMTAGGHNRVEGCTLRNIGNVAICMGEGAEVYQRRIYDNTTWNRNAGVDQGITNCRIYHCGEGGIQLGGGDRRTLTPAGNFAVGNEIYDSNRLARTYRPGIAVDGVGNRVAGNHIHDLPHFGIWLHGNDHMIERNEVDHVCLDTNDAGAFYMGRDFSERGNVIRENYFHDLGEGDLVQGVYLDDCASGTRIERNIFVRAGRGMMIGGGRDNIVEGNAFVECTPAIHLDGRGLGWASFWFNGKDATLLQRLNAVHHDRPPYSTRYPELVRLLDDHPAFPKGNRIANNLSVESRWLDLLDGLTEDDVALSGNVVYPG